MTEIGPKVEWKRTACSRKAGVMVLKAAAVCQANSSATVRAVIIAIIIIIIFIMKGRRSLEIKCPWWPSACKINIVIITKNKSLIFY